MSLLTREYEEFKSSRFRIMNIININFEPSLNIACVAALQGTGEEGKNGRGREHISTYVKIDRIQKEEPQAKNNYFEPP